jgi:hypothetical protein
MNAINTLLMVFTGDLTQLVLQHVIFNAKKRRAMLVPPFSTVNAQNLKCLTGGPLHTHSNSTENESINKLEQSERPKPQDGDGCRTRFTRPFQITPRLPLLLG